MYISTLCEMYLLHLSSIFYLWVVLISWCHGESKEVMEFPTVSYLETQLNISVGLPCTGAYNNDGEPHVICKDINNGFEFDKLPAETVILEIHCDHPELSVTKLNLYRLEELILESCSNLQLSDDVFRSTPEIRRVMIKSTYNITNFRQVLKVVSSLNKLKFLSLAKSSGFKRLQRKDLVLLNTTTIEELDLSGCEVESVERDAFEDLPKLTSFDFSSNPLSEIALRNITIGLSNRQIHKLVLRHFFHMKYLSLRNIMPLRNSSIYHLDLSDNNIPKLEAKSFAFEHLKTIKLANSKISYIHPSAFYGSLKLESMDLRGNYLKSIENQLNHVTNLRVIDISKQSLLDEKRDGKFTLVENGLRNLTNLEILSLNEAPLRNITRFMFNGLVNLEKLELSRSSIKSIADFAFETMGTLQILDLSFNNIKELSPNVFYNLENLTILDLKWNRLTLEEIDENPNSTSPFANLKSLQELSLESNDISRLPRNLLKHLTGLHFLSLRDNRLKSWHDVSFPGKSVIRQLFLSDNEIETFSEAMLKDFSSLEKIQILDLSGNPFNCADCSVYRFQKWINNNTLRLYKSLSAYMCASPGEYKGRNINERDLFYDTCELSTTTSNLNIIKEEHRENYPVEALSWIVPVATCLIGIFAIILSVVFYCRYKTAMRKRAELNPSTSLNMKA